MVSFLDEIICVCVCVKMKSDKVREGGGEGRRGDVGVKGHKQR